MHLEFPDDCPRGDGGENVRSSGTSGPVASRGDGAIFLTAATTNKGSDAWYDLIPTPGSEE